MTMPRAPLYDDDDMAANWQQGYDEGRATALLEAGELLERLRLGRVNVDEPDVTDRRVVKVPTPVTQEQVRELRAEWLRKYGSDQP